jgi:transposase InsO family protein
VGRLTKLSVNLIKAGVIPEWINPGHPEENGRHERFHLTLKDEVLAFPAETIEELILRAARFKEEYNFDRPHESLNMASPGDLYRSSSRKWDGKLRSPEYDSRP